MALTTSCTVSNPPCVSSPCDCPCSTSAHMQLRPGSRRQQHPKHSCHTLKVGNSQPLTATNPPAPASHPTFGVASGGEDGARRAEEVREIAGKTFHLLLRCLPTAEERCVAGSTSALPPRQPATEEPGGAGGERGSPSAAQGGYDSITSGRRSGSRLRWKWAPHREPMARGVSAPLLPCRSVVSCQGYLFE